MPFQLTHLLRGATHASCPRRFLQCHFNSRTSCEVRLTGGNCFCRRHKFQLTHLLRGATRSLRKKPIASPNFNSRTSCEVRPAEIARNIAEIISTHAPLARCDKKEEKPMKKLYISTHAPLARCDNTTRRRANASGFQLTHLLRGATGRDDCNAGAGHFNSRTSCEVRPPVLPFRPCLRYFNSRTSCEVRHQWSASSPFNANFNSRTSCEVRRVLPLNNHTNSISTHAPLARCDRNIL